MSYNGSADKGSHNGAAHSQTPRQQRFSTVIFGTETPAGKTFDLLLIVRARSSEHLGQLLDEIRNHAPGRSRTIVVLNSYFEGRVPPID